MPQQTSNLLARVAQGVISISFPLLLVLLAVRLVMTPLFLQVEYSRPGFPADPYGFNRQDRLQYAPYALDYLLNGAGIEYLGDLRFPDGSPLYNDNELRHMYDVKQVTQVAFAAAIIGGLIALAAAGYLWRRGRDELRRALFFGALFTLAIVAAIIILAVFNWEFFFVTFHQLFFQSGTWYFPTSDTLIRLFPEQFWFDAAIAIGGMTVLVSLLVFAITWRLGRSTALLTPHIRSDNL